MNKLLLTAVFAIFGLFTSISSHAQASKGTPVEWTPVIPVKNVPKNIQKAFNEFLSLSGMDLLESPRWTRQNGLYSVIFRSTSEFGAGRGAIRFKPYGGVVFMSFEPDEWDAFPPVID